MDAILKKAIKDTFEYGKKFGVEYEKQDIKERLISNKVFSDREIEKGLSNYELRINNYELKKTRSKKIRKAEGLAKMIEESFEDILMIGITGSVAAGYPKENDDIDLMIVTKKDKLWLTRLKLRLFIALYKIPHRKYGKIENKDEFCFNLWLDESSLELPVLKRILNNAMDLILMMPIINKKNTFEKFININNWAEKFVATGYYERTSKIKNPKSKENKTDYLDKLINWLVFWPQYLYMRNKIKQGRVGQHYAFFHPTKDSVRIKV